MNMFGNLTFAAGCGVVLLTLTSPVQAETASGVASYRNVVELNAGVSGLVSQVYGPAGSRFEKGEKLVIQEQGPFQTKIHQATVNHDLAAQKLAQAEAKFERDQELFDEGSMSLVEFDLARLALEEKQVARVNAEVALKGANYRQRLSLHKAPFDGIVLAVARQVGEFINASAEAPVLMTIARQGAFRVAIPLGAENTRDLQLGEVVTVRAGADNWEGRVGAIHYPAGADSSPTLTVDVFFDAEPGNVIAGQGVEVDLP